MWSAANFQRLVRAHAYAPQLGCRAGMIEPRTLVSASQATRPALTVAEAAGGVVKVAGGVRRRRRLRGLRQRPGGSGEAIPWRSVPASSPKTPTRLGAALTSSWHRVSRTEGRPLTFAVGYTRAIR